MSVQQNLRLMGNSRSIARLIVPTALACFLIAVPALAKDDVQQSDSPGRIGVVGALLGPASLLSGALAYQVPPELEAQLGFGFHNAEANAQTATTKATASGSLKTPFLRGRYWFGKRHAFLAEAGGGVTLATLDADALNIEGDRLTYRRDGILPVVFGGAGYGFRTDAGFRFAFIAGWLAYLGKMGDSTLTTTGNFDANDRTSIKSSLDSTSGTLADSRLYLEFTFAWMF